MKNLIETAVKEVQTGDHSPDTTQTKTGREELLREGERVGFLFQETRIEGVIKTVSQGHIELEGISPQKDILLPRAFSKS